jgi:hypothetical protein
MAIRYICAQPANSYYTWQVEVLINNFLDMGVHPSQMDILLGYNKNIPQDWKKLQEGYPDNRFFFYEDTRENKSYIPAIYFHLVKKHLQDNPDLEKEVLFLHDSDIIFTKKPDFKGMVPGDRWYLSDTNSYINYSYIQQKGNHIYERMCEIVGLDWRIPKLMNYNSGGAQYIVKNTNYEFWDKVERDAVKLYEYFCKEEPNYIKKHDNDYPIQKWTAGMWSLLWNAWYYGHETVVDSRLDFGWVTNNIAEVDKYTILHNAGVTESSKDLFFKGNYINKLPYKESLDINPDKASYFYYEWVKKVGEKSKLLI